MTIEELGQQTKAKYPQYQNLSDADVGKAVLKKYPVYEKEVDRGFLRETAEAIARPFARAGLSVAKTAGALSNIQQYAGARLSGDKQAAQQILNRNPLAKTSGGQVINKTSANVPFLGQVEGIENPAQAFGPGLEIGTTIAGGTGLPQIFKGAAKMGVRQLAGRAAAQTAKEGIYLGAGSGLGSALQEEEATFGSVIGRTALGGLVGGAVGGVIGGATGLGFKAIHRNTTKAIDETIKRKFVQAVRPSVAGKKSLEAVEQYNEKAVDAIRIITNNKNNLKFVTEVGEETGRLPKSLVELADAIEQTKSRVFNDYNTLAVQSGKTGATVDLKPLAGQLDKVIKNKALQISHPQAVEYAQALQSRFIEYGKVSITEAQDIIKNYNEALKAFYRNPTMEGVNKASIEAGVVRVMREQLDDIITKTTGPGYQQLKNEYGALKTIENDVVRRAIVDSRKNVKGLLDFTDIFSGGDIVAGLTTANPALLARGVAQRGIKEWFKALNDPNRMVGQIFKAAEKTPRATSQTTSTGLKSVQGLSKKKINSAGAVGGIEQDENGEYKFNPAHAALGIAGLSVAQKGLTTKIIGELEKKAGTVSKQFIQDLTNQGSIKQAERDLIRKSLEEVQGSVVNAKEFANKVKTELLPLKRSSTIPNSGNISQEDYLKYKGTGQYASKYESITLPDGQRGPVANYSEHIYESPIKTSAGDVHFGSGNGGMAPNYFAHTRVEDLPITKTGTLYRTADGDLVRVSGGTQNFRAIPGERGGTSGVNVTRVSDGKPLGLMDLKTLTPEVPATTRRVIELQSDLFQKGRLESEGIGPKADLNRNTWGGPFEAGLRADAKERLAGLTKLEPYRNTWHERVIREEVKQAAKDGKTVLQFPTGETAMKIEGLGQGEQRWSELYHDGEYNLTNGSSRLKPEKLEVGKLITNQETFNHIGDSDQWIITDVLGDGKFKAIPKNVDDATKSWEVVKDTYVPPSNPQHLAKNSQTGEVLNFPSRKEAEKYVEQARIGSVDSYSETFDISGKVDQSNPIYKFYEKEIGKYLKNKYNATMITDPQGVSWYQVAVPKTAARAPVEAFGAIAGLGGLQQNREEPKKSLGLPSRTDLFIKR